MPGLLVDGHAVDVEGVTIVSPGDDPNCILTQGKDWKPRTNRPHQIILHKTIADDPERVISGAGPAGGAEKTALFFLHSDGKVMTYRNAGAHIVIGEDGIAWNLADLVTAEVFHATVSNLYSIGIESREVVGGGVYQATLESMVAIVIAICRATGIQFQVPRLPYKGHPMRRMIGGGPDMIGVFGHRDNTEDRGRWDPGDVVFALLRQRGALPFDFDAGEDLVFWKGVQKDLAMRGLYHGPIDGIPGHGTTEGLRADGYRDGIYALGRA